PRRTASATLDGRNDSAQEAQSDHHASRPTEPNKRNRFHPAIADRIFGGMARVSKGHKKGRWRVLHSRGLARPWRTLGPAIPRQVASPQSPLPFRQTNQG